MVDIVSFHGDEVIGSIKVNAPVVVTIAGCRVGSYSIDVVVGESDTVGGTGSENNVLTANQ